MDVGNAKASHRDDLASRRFPLRLFQNNTTEYEYCPCPGIAYKRLEKEIFRHNYYHNLCDEDRSDWPRLLSSWKLFRACLCFKQQVDLTKQRKKQPLKKLGKTLDLKVGDGAKSFGKAYRGQKVSP
jgi:hypothetical protein